jgi:Flp pilus assembly protein protease CpaA
MMDSVSPLALVWLHIGLILWLLPCAIQDRRYHRVSNWLTIPLFLVAWPAALLFGTHIITLAVFAGVWAAFHWRTDAAAPRNLGGADGKIAVGIAALTPLGLMTGIVVQGLAFLVCRLRGQRDVRLPGAVSFYLGVLVAFVYAVLLLVGKTVGN